MNLREQYEALELKILAPAASFSSKSRGRLKEEPKDPVRTEYQRDRDRIIHSKAFRRLSHKTQVFIAPEKDHYRTRLTHALEVAQISRTVARALRLNEDLTEAIALGHDLGHTPFGHIGEDALTECLQEVGAPKSIFRHNEQSLRVVDIVERKGKGLNLTYEVRDGILNHTGDTDPETLEGQIVKICDRIAYVNHDIDDALRAGIISFSDLPRGPINILGRTHGERIDALVKDMIKASSDLQRIRLSPEIESSLLELRSWLFEAVYLNPEAKSEDKKAKQMLKELFYYYFERPEELPKSFKPENEEELPIRICDYIAGMTDRFALRLFEEIFVPKRWMV
jgi:dGTPase